MMERASALRTASISVMFCCSPLRSWCLKTQGTPKLIFNVQAHCLGLLVFHHHALHHGDIHREVRISIITIIAIWRVRISFIQHDLMNLLRSQPRVLLVHQPWAHPPPESPSPVIESCPGGWSGMIHPSAPAGPPTLQPCLGSTCCLSCQSLRLNSWEASCSATEAHFQTPREDVLEVLCLPHMPATPLFELSDLPIHCHIPEGVHLGRKLLDFLAQLPKFLLMA